MEGRFVVLVSTNNPKSPKSSAAPFPADRELVLQRVLNAPRGKLWRCWTTPELIVQWFTPTPWKTVRAVVDVRASGSSHITMQSPEGLEFPNSGIYLEVVPHERLVFTDAFTCAWEPSAKPFMTCVLTFEDAGNGQTKYTARARHWTVADREAHEKMGFHEGWGIATNQLEALAQKI
ncbi:MAG TPA: SRPBCC family protein [Lacunisphaera sp.]|nr:SRPBCC family protein [Lacunisphaera sp.]